MGEARANMRQLVLIRKVEGKSEKSKMTGLFTQKKTENVYFTFAIDVYVVLFLSCLSGPGTLTFCERMSRRVDCDPIVIQRVSNGSLELVTLRINDVGIV